MRRRARKNPGGFTPAAAYHYVIYPRTNPQGGSVVFLGTAPYGRGKLDYQFRVGTVTVGVPAPAGTEPASLHGRARRAAERSTAWRRNPVEPLDPSLFPQLMRGGAPLQNPKISQKALREHLRQHHVKMEADLRAREAADRVARSKQPFRWSAPSGYSDTAGYQFLRSLEGSTYARDVAPYLKVTETRVTLSVPPTANGRVRYGVHEGFAGSEHPQAWKPRNAFDAWADLTGGLDGPERDNPRRRR